MAYDANVCSWTKAPNQPWKFITIAGEPFSHEVQFSRNKRKVRLHANQKHILAEIVGDFSAEPVGINGENKNGPQMVDTGKHKIGNNEYRVFAKDSKLSLPQAALLTKPEFVRLVEKMGLFEGEMIVVSRSAVSLYLVRPDSERLMQAIDQGISLAGQMESNPAVERKDFQKLPSQFHPIIPLLEKWSISDDSDREDLLARFPKPTLKALVDEVSPYFDSINSYLDSFGEEPLPAEAAALGRLAECAAEARVCLQEPGR